MTSHSLVDTAMPGVSLGRWCPAVLAAGLVPVALSHPWWWLVTIPCAALSGEFAGRVVMEEMVTLVKFLSRSHFVPTAPRDTDQDISHHELTYLGQPALVRDHGAIGHAVSSWCDALATRSDVSEFSVRWVGATSGPRILLHAHPGIGVPAQLNLLAAAPSRGRSPGWMLERSDYVRTNDHVTRVFRVSSARGASCLEPLLRNEVAWVHIRIRVHPNHKAHRRINRMTHRVEVEENWHRRGGFRVSPRRERLRARWSYVAAQLAEGHAVMEVVMSVVVAGVTKEECDHRSRQVVAVARQAGISLDRGRFQQASWCHEAAEPW